jgi:hypothetical protein
LAAGLLAAASLALASCAAQQTGRIRGDFSAGAFTGSAGPELVRALEKVGLSGGGEGNVLTGSAEFRYSSSPGRETVVVTERGEERVYWEDDPLTGQAWLVTARVGDRVPRDFDFSRQRGILEVDWSLLSPSGRVLRSGRDVFSASVASGGYADRSARGTGGSPPAAPDGQAGLKEASGGALLEELAALAASQLAVLAGPRILEGDLAPVPDPDGRSARSLAASGDWEAAARIWEGLLSRNPSYDPALYNLGLYHEILGDLPGAWRYFRLAFRSRQLPLYREALSRASEILRRTGNLPRPDGSR